MDYRNWSNGVKGMVAGGLAGFVEIWFTFPLDFVKIQLQLDSQRKSKLYNGAFDCIRKTVEKDGFGGLYSGFAVNLCGNIPQSAIRFGSYEYLRAHMADDKGKLSWTDKLLCGVGSGLCEAIVITTVMQTIIVKMGNDRMRPNPRFKGFVHCVKIIIKEEGLTGLYRGVTPTIIKQCSNQAIRFTVVETLKDYYTGNNHNNYIPNAMVGLFGSVAGSASVLVNNPIDVVKQRMQSLNGSKYKSTLDCIIQIWKNEKLFAFYKGLLPRLTRVSLDEGSTFFLFDWLMDQFKNDLGDPSGSTKY